MNKNNLLIYIGEKKAFDVAKTIAAIASIKGVSGIKMGEFIGAFFECQYKLDDAITTVRISNDAETVTVEGMGDLSLEFALALQARLPVPLYAIDLNASFNVGLKYIANLAEFKDAITVWAD